MRKTGKLGVISCPQKKRLFPFCLISDRFFLLAVLLAPESHFAKYHANQGLVLFLTEVVVSTVIMVGRYIPLIGWTFQLLNIVIVVLFFLGLSHAIREVEEPLPFIGEIQILK